MHTLEALKPQGYTRPVAVTAEYAGKRYLITHATDWHSAELVAIDFAGTFRNAIINTTDVYNSMAIDGKARDFTCAYAEREAS